MQRDLDRLMAERHLDAIIVEGPDGLGAANPAFNYFVRGAHLVGTVIKKRGEPAMLIHSDWERLQAEETGLVCVSSSRWNVRDIMSRIPDRLGARVELRRQMLNDLGVRARRIVRYSTGGTVFGHATPARTCLARRGICGRIRQRHSQCRPPHQR